MNYDSGVNGWTGNNTVNGIGRPSSISHWVCVHTVDLCEKNKLISLHPAKSKW